MNAPRIRLNEREVNPNPYINFISPLKDKADHESAHHILKAVAAQMKPVMKERFLLIGDLAEGKFNKVWAGLNYCHGQTIYLVLRNAAGRFLPLPYIVDVMCHEMAHIQQMNHGPKFQKLMAEIKADVRRLQARGYFGDGLWSDGHRVSDGIKTSGIGLSGGDFPEHICAGVFSRAGARRPGQSKVAGPSLSSGRQVKRIRKAGGRVDSEMGGGDGLRLDGRPQITAEDQRMRKMDIDRRTQELVSSGVELKKARRQATAAFDKAHPAFIEGKSRGKRAASKSAAEMRAEIAERRLAGLPKPSVKDEHSEEPEDSNVDQPSDSDQETDDFDPMTAPNDLGSMSKEERDALRGGWESYVVRPSESHDQKPGCTSASDGPIAPDATPGWTCLNCTMPNITDHGRCATCGSKPDGTIPQDVKNQLIM